MEVQIKKRMGRPPKALIPKTNELAGLAGKTNGPTFKAFALIPSKEFGGLFELKELTIPASFLKEHPQWVKVLSEADSKGIILNKMRIAAYEVVIDPHV